MKKLFVIGTLFVMVAGLSIVLLFPYLSSVADKDLPEEGDDPDMPSFLQTNIPREDFMSQREENIAKLRGLNNAAKVDPKQRQEAIVKMEDQEARVASMRNSAEKQSVTAAWTELGPNPIPNGQVVSGSALAVSGRTTAIAINPSNPNIVYVGTAQGGLYRTLDGGTTWTPMMDNAKSLAIGAVTIAPSQTDTIYVGTGEAAFSSDSFFGVGVYRIDNASTANPVITGPLNKDASNTDIFTGRGIAEIIVHPTDPATIFVASASGVGGISGSANSILPSRGIYRSTNATAANPTFTKLTGLATNTNASVRDIAIDPLNPNLLVANPIASGGVGGIYVSTDALSPNPTFTQRSVFTSTSTSQLTAEFAVQHTVGDPNPTFYAATGNGPGNGGRVLMSTDGGTTWTQQIANAFCGGQCFYNIAIDVDPTDAKKVYLGGTGNSTTFTISSNNATSFTSSASGLHTDSHVIAVAPSNPTIIYFGSDGGIYKSINSGANWSTLNNTTFRATQFMSIAVHPTDPNFTIGGTQDNGTNMYRADATWFRVDGGDGGFTLIDQNATDTTNVRMYHTYYNSAGSLLGYATTGTANGGWSFRGCQSGSGTVNGINCADTAVLFYAPLEQGPGNPNSVYYGTDRLYRSVDFGVTNTPVSQAPIQTGVPLSAIGISPQNDNIRIVGLSNGAIWGTTTGSSTLTDLDSGNAIPNSYVSRAVISPTNPNKAYITLSNFNVVNVWKTSNLSDPVPTWTAAAGTGLTALPLVPVSSFLVDKIDPNTLYAGTDIGVYISTDDGATWTPFGTGLPRVAVFDMAITSANKLRIATHGRGLFEIPLSAPSTAKFDFDGDGKADVSTFRPSNGIWYLNQSTAGFTGVQFGDSADKLTPADYDGDGKTDVAVFRPSNGTWYLNRSQAGFTGIQFGDAADIPQPADFDGDGKAELAVFRPSTGTWFVYNLTSNSFTSFQFGASTDKPVVGDFDGDGKADYAVFRPSTGVWYIQGSTAGFYGMQFGASTDKPVAADYDGDGKTDIAVFRPSNGVWYINRSTAGFIGTQFGASTDLAAPADYDGDGKADLAVFRPSNGVWYIQQSGSGLIGVPFGAGTDKPVPNAYIP